MVDTVRRLDHRVSVLILGPRGSGKGHLAQRLVGERGELRVADCTAVSPDHSAAMSYLFGHKKGAFTGAATERDGVLGAGKQDDLVFLDELHHLPRETQGLLLRAIETRSFAPLGAGPRETVSLRGRIVAASNVSDEELREKILPDLYERLATVVIDLEPLAKRGDDVIRLAKSLAVEVGREVRSDLEVKLAPEALAVLASHPIHGNVRGLKTWVTRAVIHALQEEVEASHLELSAAAVSATAARVHRHGHDFAASLVEARAHRLMRSVRRRAEDRVPTLPLFSVRGLAGAWGCDLSAVQRAAHRCVQKGWLKELPSEPGTPSGAGASAGGEAAAGVESASGAHGAESASGAHGAESASGAHGAESASGAHGAESASGAHGAESASGAHGAESASGATALTSREGRGAGDLATRSVSGTDADPDSGPSGLRTDRLWFTREGKAAAIELANIFFEPVVAERARR